jgi:hypothetical protein
MQEDQFGVKDGDRLTVLLDDLTHELERLNETLERIEARDHEVRR